MSFAPSLPRRLATLLALAGVGLALAIAGCSDSSAPKAPADGDLGGVQLTGEFNPTGGSYLLKRLDQAPPDRQPILVDLVGSNLQFDTATEVVSIDVAMRNAGPHPLYAPSMVWVFAPRPAGVTVTNADVVPGPPDTNQTDPPVRDRYGFDYTQLLGGDPVLAPGETSDVKTWRFHVPGLTGFSFGARAEFGMVPDLPRIAGRCFLDADRDGLPGPDEGPVMGMVGIAGPDSFTMSAVTGPDGRYAVPIEQPGLYTLHFMPLIRRHDDGAKDGDHPVQPPRPIFTTPNPLQVTLPPGPDGRPHSFLDADFGVVFAQAPPDTALRVIHWEAPFDSLSTDGYSFIEGGVRGSVLVLRVGFSGCGPAHPFALYWQQGPEASPLAHVHLFLKHDDLGEMCDAWFTRDLRFNLSPIRRAMGGGVVPVILNLMTPDGQMHTFMLPPADPD